MHRSRVNRRLPLTITLVLDDYKFIESCVSLKQFRSVDELFHACLAFYRKHVEMLEAYAQEQGFKGYTRSEILEAIEVETLVTRRKSRARSKRRPAKRRIRRIALRE